MSKTFPPQTPAREQITNCLEKPLLDDRLYRVIKLPNQLEVLLVHDADTDKASAAMDVNVGYFSDPEELPGLAHCLEHMLFLGTKKYPEENAYSQYLFANSGNCNAYTVSTSTNYYFEVAAKPAEDTSSPGTVLSPLYGALDRFSQFFIEPLFLSETLDRELHAVDSENKKNRQSDQWRLYQLDKSLSNPNHPYRHFSTGNLETLKLLPEAKGIDVRQKFMDFHERQYSANRMKLVLLGREPLDTLEEWVAGLFANVKNKGILPNRWEGEQPFREQELLTQYFAKPVMETRILDLYFPINDEEDLYESQPSRYLSHLIGHEGPGSIMSYIKSKGWANGLSAEAYPICPGTQELFSCEIRLTEDGLKNYKEIVKVFFQYVSLLRESPPQQWIFDEQRGLAEADFKFRQKSPTSKFTSEISAVMQKPLPREWLLSGNSIIRKFDPAAIKGCLSYLRPDNFRMSVVSQEFPGDWNQKEHWYGTEYKYEKIPADLLEEIKKAATSHSRERLAELHLPHKNQFIPTKLEVEKKDVNEPARAPKLIRNDELIRAWFKKDDQFWVPKANVHICCKNPLLGASPENYVKASIYADLVRDALEEYAYDAQLAGLSYTLGAFPEGLKIQVSGYNDKLLVLLERVFMTMRDLVIKQDRFEIVKERFLRHLRNSGLQQPYNQVGDYTRWLCNEEGFINDQMLAELEPLTVEDVRTFFPYLLRQMHVETLVHGNLYKEDALRLNDLLEKTLKPRPLLLVNLPIVRSLIFPLGNNVRYRKTLRDPKNVNHCIEYFLYIGSVADRQLRAMVLLLDQLTHEPTFNQLRTKEQLGYIVSSGYRTFNTTMGFRFTIQSEKKPEYLESRIDAFLEGYEKTMENLTIVEFEGHKRSLTTKLQEKLKNLDQESSGHWVHIEGGYYDFESAYIIAKLVATLTKSDMIQMFRQYISPSSPARAKLAIHLHAQAVSDVSASAKSIVHKVAEIVEDGIDMLRLGKSAKDMINTPEIATTELSKNLYIIDDVRDYKSRLTVTVGPQPVKDLSEFEDMDVKL